MHPKSVYVVGGQQRKLGHDQKEEWHVYGQAMILRVDLESGATETCVEYVSPPEACATESPSILFKAGTVQDNKLYVCTQTEVLIYGLPHFEQLGYVSLPCFNDLHHVTPTSAGNLLVAVTGLDLVIEMTPQGDVLREWNVLGQDPWERFSRTMDYRKVVTTKPHQAHPNYIFQQEQDIWVTRFEQRDAICLTRPGSQIPIEVQRVHDGVVYGDLVYFTAVDGHVAVGNFQTNRIENLTNLNEIIQTDRALGWCRGMYVIDEDQVMVGFSRLRPTIIRENLRWVKRRLSGNKTGNLSTRIALYNLKQKKLYWEYDLEPAGLNAVFSIHLAE